MAKEDLSEAVKRIVVSFINACSTTLKNGINIKISNGHQSNHIPASFIVLFRELIKKIIIAYKKISESEIDDLVKSIFEEHNDSVESIVKELENSMESIVKELENSMESIDNEIEKKNKGLKNKILYVPDNYLKPKIKNIKNHTSNGHDQCSSDHSGNNQTVEIINKEQLSKHECFQESKRDIKIKCIGIKKLGMRRDSTVKNLCEKSINEYSKLESDNQSLEKIVFSFLKTNNESLLNEINALMNKIQNNMETNGITSNLEINIQDGSKFETNKNYIQIVNYNGNYYISQLIQFLSEKQFTQRGKQSILFHFLDHDIKELGKYLKFLFEFSNNNVNNSIDNNTIDNNTFENNTNNNNNINNNIINNNIINNNSNLKLKNEYNFSLDMYPVHENLLNLIINDLIINEKQELNIVQLLVILYILEFYKNNNDYEIHDDILLNIKLHHMKLPSFISDQDDTINSVLIKNINEKKIPKREKKRKRKEEEFDQSPNKEVVSLEKNKKFKMKKSLGESVKPLETTENMDKKLYINKKYTNNSVNQREDNQKNTRMNHELGKQQIIQNFIKYIDDEGVLKIIPFFDLLIRSFNLSIDEYCFICTYNTLQFAIVVIIQELIKFLQQHSSELSKKQVDIVINDIIQLILNPEKIHYCKLQYSSYIKDIKYLLSKTEKTEEVNIDNKSGYIISKVLKKIIDECSDFKFSKYGGDNCSILNINIMIEYIEKYMKFSDELYSNFYSILKQDLRLPYSPLE